eukprot:8487736-Alexandrium_andersonii.AAC.1
MLVAPAEAFTRSHCRIIRGNAPLLEAPVGETAPPRNRLRLLPPSATSCAGHANVSRLRQPHGAAK